MESSIEVKGKVLEVSSPSHAAQIVGLLEAPIAQAVAEIGYDLEDLDVQLAGRRRLVRVVVDSDDGVGLDQIAEISRCVSTVLDDHEHVLAGSYTLEVTSPGVDRPLTKPRHWRRALHRLARLQLRDGSELAVRVGRAEDDGVVVLAQGQPRRVDYRDVEHAVVEVEFQQPPAEELVQLERAAGGVSPQGNDREYTEESR